MGIFDEILYSQAANRQIKKKAKAEYYRAKEEQQMRVARERASIEADRRIKSMRTSGGGGFLDSIYGQGGILGVTPKASPTRRVVHRRKSKPSSKRARTRVVYVQAPPRRYW